MNKKAIITISLVEKGAERANDEIEREIFEEVSEDFPMIPWLKRVEKATVT